MNEYSLLVVVTTVYGGNQVKPIMFCSKSGVIISDRHKFCASYGHCRGPIKLATDGYDVTFTEMN